jgi:hypothetical protein
MCSNISMETMRSNLALRVRIGNRRDLRIRELPRHPQRQRPPAATEFEDRLSAGQIGVLDGLAQRFLLGFLQGRGCLPVETAGILAVGAEQAGKELDRHLVVRNIGVVGIFGDGARRHFVGEPGIAFRIPGGEPRGGARAELVDGGADNNVRQRHPLGGAHDRGNEAHVATPFGGERAAVAGLSRKQVLPSNKSWTGRPPHRGEVATESDTGTARRSVVI